MKRLLTKEEFVPFALKSPGIRRVNHVSDYCHGDSNSMIVETKDNGDISAHCFRCGSGGFAGGPAFYQSADDRRAAATARANRAAGEGSNIVIGGIWLPDDATGAYSAFPQAVRAWLSKAALTAAQLDREQFLWSDETCSLYIPVRIETDLVGYVKRSFNTEAKQYRTLKIDKNRFFGYYRKEEKPTKRVVIVEDVLSGLRCQEVCDTIAVLGTNLSPMAQTTIMAAGYEEAAIFLDADNPTVRSETRRIKKKLPFLKVRIIETGKDPKHYSKSQLERLINEN